MTVDPTDNHDFPLIDPGTEEDTWGTVINDQLTEVLDDRVPIVDDVANISQYTPTQDAIFVGKTGSGYKVYLGDGTSWVAQSLGSASEPIEGTSHFEAVSAEVLNNSTYNAKAFGAVGDGATDDTDAIQTTLDAAENDGGGTVYIPEGEYIIGKDGTNNADEIRPGDNITIKGAGKGTTVLKLADGTELDVIRNKQAADHTTTPNQNITIKDLSIDGNYENAPTDSNNQWTKFVYSSDYNEQWTCCARLKNVENCHVENVHVYNATGYGLQYADAQSCSAEQVYAEANGDDGVSVSDGRSGQQLTERVQITDSFAWDNFDGRTDVIVGSGFEVDDGPRMVEISDCVAFNNRAGYDVHCHSNQIGPNGVHFNNCLSFSNSEMGFALGKYNDEPIKNIGVKDGYSFGDAVGVSSTDVETVRVDGLEIAAPGTQAILLDADDRGDIKKCDIRDVTIRAAGSTGIMVKAQTNVAKFITVKGCTVELCQGTGINFDGAEQSSLRNNDLIANSQSANDTYDNILVQGDSTDCSVTNNTCRIGEQSNNPRYGINLQTGGTVVSENDLRGAGATGNLNDTGGNEVRYNEGYDTEHSGVEIDVIDTNTSGEQTITVSHGLNITPNSGEIGVYVANGPNNGEKVRIEQVRQVGPSSFDVIVDVTSTSGGTGEAASLAWNVGAY